MKKWLAWILVLMLAFGSFSSVAEEMSFDDDETPAANAGDYVYTGPEYDYDHLVIGNTTAVSGNFASIMWGSNTSDLDVLALINGYNLVRWDFGAGNFVFDDTVVAGQARYANEEGDRTYIIYIMDDMKYSDGTPITADDYAFNILLSMSPEARAIGGDTDNYPCIVGSAAYKNEETKKLAGLKVISDTMLSITVSHEYVPFFYELGLLRCYPMPIHLIAPGCKVASDTEGAYIDGAFTSGLLAKTLLDPETGYVSRPAAVSGPYRLISYDAENSTVEFEINDLYLGNWQGIKPTIRRLTLKPASNDTMIGALENGEFGLLNKSVNKETIDNGIALIGTQNFAMSTYPRIGQSYISFNCEKETVSSQAVRQAIAWCLDKDTMVDSYTGGYGIRVDGYYGLGQWMYQVMTGAIDPPVPPAETEADTKAYEEQLAAWEALSMDDIPVYQLDVPKAVKLLEDDGWTLNRNGEPFVAGQDDVRCKEIDGQLVALDLTMVYPETNAMENVFEETFLRNLREAGIRVTAEPMEWHQLLRQFYRQEERSCDMMYLASNFEEVFDPWPTFDPADAAVGKTNYSGIESEELYEKAMDMSRTEPGDLLGYEIKWLAFQKCYEEVLPAIPVYGNAYFDFYTRCLQNYLVSENVTWTEAIVAATFAKPVAEPVAEEPAEDDESFFDD